MNDKTQLREELWERCQGMWPGLAKPQRPPEFPGQNKAAERLRRTQAWRLARCVVVMPDPVLLQVRINALQDGKQLMAASPGLKQGFVRLEPEMVPVALRRQSLGGHAMPKQGKRLRFPQSKPGRAGLMVVPGLAVDQNGVILGDGRGLTDLTYALLREVGTLSASTPVAVLLDDEQVLPELPAQPWDLRADMAVTATTLHKFETKHARPGLKGLPPNLAALPVVRSIGQMG